MIIKNNLIFDSSFPFIIEKKYNELSFLNKKKVKSKNSENININEISSEKMTKEFNLLKNLNIPKKERIFKISKNRKKYRNLKYYNNLYKIEKNNSLFINKSNVETKYLKNIIINQDINDKGKNNSKENNLNKKDDLSNSIKTMKNHKLIYINKFLIKPKFKNNDVVVEKRKRSSLYRGVSKNGNNWQVIISSKYNKGYIGVFKTQEIAARIYDIISIKNKGIKAKTNFKYDIHQIQNIGKASIDYKSEDIEVIISNLINK